MNRIFVIAIPGLMNNRTGRAVAVVEFLSTLLSPVVGGENLDNFSREHEMSIAFIIKETQSGKFLGARATVEQAKRSVTISYEKLGEVQFTQVGYFSDQTFQCQTPNGESLTICPVEIVNGFDHL